MASFVSVTTCRPTMCTTGMRRPWREPSCPRSTPAVTAHPEARPPMTSHSSECEIAMNPIKVHSAAAIFTMLALLLAPSAGAEYEEYAMNGTFSVVSNGEWARMNDRYQDEPTVRSTWTVDTVCSSAITCSGKVTSSLGWTEDIYTGAG